MKLIPLSQGKFAQVDDEDFDFLNQWNWCAVKRPHTFYAIRQVRKENDKQRSITIAHEIMNLHSKLQEGKIIDHKDRNGLNNQKSNLRNATPAENSRNITPYGRSKYLGVCFHIASIKRQTKNFGLRQYKTSRWVSRIQINGIRKHLGYFISEQDAALAYNKAAEKYFGEFASINIIK